MNDAPLTKNLPLVFLPGFDGAPRLRQPFLDELSDGFEVRVVEYPNRCLVTLEGYCQWAARGVGPEDRVILVAESFSTLVAAWWAASDPRVAGLVLCAGFLRNPAGFAASVGAALPALAKLGALVTRPLALLSKDESRRQWNADLAEALSKLKAEVVAERLRLIRDSDVEPELGSLRIPIVLAQFDDDFVIPIAARRQLEATCHNAEVVGIPGPHFAIETRPRECASALRGPIRKLMETEPT